MPTSTEPTSAPFSLPSSSGETGGDPAFAELAPDRGPLVLQRTPGVDPTEMVSRAEDPHDPPLPRSYKRELFEKGHVYVGVPPLYRVEFGPGQQQQRYCYDERDLKEFLESLGTGAKFNVQRFKVGRIGLSA